LFPTVRIPFWFFLADLLYTIEKPETALRKHSADRGAPQEQVIQVHHCLVSRCPTEFCPYSIGSRNAGKLIIPSASNHVFHFPPVTAGKPYFDRITEC
jgi:hypothetical protein